MSLLCDKEWKLKCTPDDCNLVTLFFVPALECAVRYDRITGYFSARALPLAARGLEGLIRNGERMRLLFHHDDTVKPLPSCGNGYREREQAAGARLVGPERLPVG